MKGKTCCACKETKPESEYSFKYRERGIRTTKCRACTNKYSQKHYEKNKEVYIARAIKHNKRYIKQKKEFIMELKMSNPCLGCGETNPTVLEFDHINPKDKKGNIATMIRGGYSVGTILKEALKCQILCANCHRKKTAKDYKYFSTKV